MPVVTLYLNRLRKLVGGNINKNKIISTLPFLGLDIEEQTTEYVRVEYSPNRPDYATDFGVAIGLQGLLGIKRGLAKFNVKKGTNFYQLKVDPSVTKIRPFVTAIVAKNGKLDDETIRQLITLQEDLHFGIGRHRKKSSIGIHDLDNISFPLRYIAVSKDHKFTPLESTIPLTAKEILERTDVGKQYSGILGNTSKVPMILDSKKETVSFPPIINAALTTISTTKTTNLLIEVTSTDKSTAEDTLSVVAATLQNAGFDLYSVKISGGKNSTPPLKNRTIRLDPTLINKTLGLRLTPSTICTCLRRSRLDAIIKNSKIVCTIPPFRFDILGPMDLVEEVTLGYGIENLESSLPPSVSIGHKDIITKDLDRLSLVMIGLGFLEALNSSMVNKKVQFELTSRDSSKMIEIVESKSQEHTVLRDAILPGLLENLSKNIHEPYPQKLFETGVIFSSVNPINEDIDLACVSAYNNANFTEMKSVLQSALKIGFSIKCETKTSHHPMFSSGRTADVVVNNKVIGRIGEIDSKVIDNFKIRVPVVGFEIKLTGLIFDNIIN